VTPERRPPTFVVIGENIHCSRVVRRDGPRGGVDDAGRPVLRFPDGRGGEAALPLPPAILESSEFAANGRIKHVMAAVRVGLAGGPDAATAAAYVRWLAERQVAGGAHYLDLNVDEIDHAVDGRLAAMVWLVRAVGPVASVPLSIDSSDASVLEAGVAALEPAWGGGRAPLVNSASVERPEVLDLARDCGSPVVLSCTGTVMPTTTDERVERAMEIVELAIARGLAPCDLYVDALIIPIGVDAEAGNAYLEAVRAIRQRFGPEIHITGGVSNVSFGLPARRLIGDVFLDLCVQAGQDSGIVDPVAADIAAALAPDRDAEPYRLAAAMLTGADPFGMAFIDAYRAGRLTLGNAGAGSDREVDRRPTRGPSEAHGRTLR
jgi:5-methyltetrahydrofolate--homocysteine methyltransferase